MCTEEVKEILDRTRRLETRMVQLGDYVGANLRSKQRIDVRASGSDAPYVVIDSLDVSVSRILTELRQANVHARVVDVYCDHIVVFSIYPTAAARVKT